MEVHQRGKRLKMTFQWREVKDFQLIFFAYCVRVCVLCSVTVTFRCAFLKPLLIRFPSLCPVPITVLLFCAHVYGPLFARPCVVCQWIRERDDERPTTMAHVCGADDSSSGCSITFEHVSMCFVAATETVLTISSRSCGLEERRRLQIRWSISQFHRTGLFYY